MRHAPPNWEAAWAVVSDSQVERDRNGKSTGRPFGLGYWPHDDIGRHLAEVYAAECRAAGRAVSVVVDPPRTTKAKALMLRRRRSR